MLMQDINLLGPPDQKGLCNLVASSIEGSCSLKSAESRHILLSSIYKVISVLFE